MRQIVLAVMVLLSSLAMGRSAAAESTQPIKAVMYVGGCCHDYKVMPRMLADKIEEIANVKIEIRHMATAEEMAAAFADPKFGDSFDLIIYDICFGEKWKDGDYDPALKAAEAGKPAMFVHCSAHTYRPPRNPKAIDLMQRRAIADAKWHSLVGMDSIVHDKFEPFATVKVAKDHPILKNFPDNWKTPGDELYNTIKMMPNSTPLLQATSPMTGKTHTVAWVNLYGKARIFGTTLGHDFKTGNEPAYHQLLADGLLWACGKLDDSGNPLPGYAGHPKAPAAATEQK